MKSLKKKALILVVLLLALNLIGCFYSNYCKNDKKKELSQIVEVTEPTLTNPPDAALPMLYMNGEIYRVDPISENLVAYDETDFIGTVESKIAYNTGPTKEMQSNCLPVGTMIYKDKHMEGAYICISYEKRLAYYHRCTLLQID